MGIFRFLGFREGYYGIWVCFCCPITCAPPEIIARWSLMGLQGVPGNFRPKKSGGRPFWGNFRENMISAEKRHWNPCALGAHLLKSLPGGPWWVSRGFQVIFGPKKVGGGLFGAILGKIWFPRKKGIETHVHLVHTSWNHCLVVPDGAPGGYDPPKMEGGNFWGKISPPKKIGGKVF